jgi:hypothetical protein
MLHNYEAGGSGTGGERSSQFTLNEAGVLYQHRISVPMNYRPPHGWHLSAVGYAVSPPPSDGPELRSLIEERCLLIEERRAQMPPAERCCPE